MTRDPLIRTPLVQSGAIAALSGLEGGTSLSHGARTRMLDSMGQAHIVWPAPGRRAATPR
jgi:hypothetical protein